jgi:drug/metabolite transporter (DMT)-like permease
MLIAAFVITPIYMVSYRSVYQKVPSRDLLLMLLSALLLAVHFGLWITSLEYTSIASSVVLATSHPIFIAILSYFLWKERLSIKVILGIILALIGVIVINWGGFILSSTAFIGNILALSSAIAIGIHLMIGRQLRERVRLMQYLTTVYGGAALILVIAVLITGYSLIGYSANTYLMLMLLALIPQFVGHSLLNQAVRLMSVTIVATAIVGEPIGAIIWGYLILGEGITTVEIVGSLLTLGGISAVVLYWHKAALIKS